MLDFRELNIADKVWIDELMRYSDFQGTEYCFTSLFIWDKVYHSLAARYKDFFILRSVDAEYARYLYPAGRGDIREIIEVLSKDADSVGKKFSLISIPPSGKKELEDLFPGRFEIREGRNSFDYIYSREALATLTGKKYQSKRNHIARFKELEGWSYERIDPTDPQLEAKLEECRLMSDEWCKQNGCYDNVSLHNETCAVRKALNHFSSLNLKGGLLRLNEKVVAFTIGEPLNSNTYIIHVEKAFSEIRGAYPFINQQFIISETEGYEFINREDDAGDEGLRKAKLSYNPVLLLEKYYTHEK